MLTYETLVFEAKGVDSFPKALLDNLAGALNESDFAGHPRGTLLFGDVEMAPRSDPSGLDCHVKVYQRGSGWNEGEVGPGLPFPYRDFAGLSAFLGR
jgi:hypothetical protein